MAVVIMLAGLVAAFMGTALAIAMGLDLSFAFVIYGVFGICGGFVACLGAMPLLRSIANHRPRNDRLT